jgi:hypothetical protein
MAQSLGIHKDGSAFQLSPFDCELRRRLWWQISILDIRAAEDYGLLSLSVAISKDMPRYPSNINDKDIWPGMTEVPISSTDFTDMTLAVMRIQCTDLINNQGLYPVKATTEESLLSGIESKRNQLRETSIKMFDLYLSSQSIREHPVYEAGLLLWRVSLMKSEFLLMFRAFQSGLIADKEALCKETIESAVRILENLPQPVSHAAFKRFMWYPKSYPQWYAIGFILQQLYQGNVHDPVLQQRAQAAVEEAFAALEETASDGATQRRGAIWVALCLLKDKALNKSSNPSDGGLNSSNSIPSDTALSTPESAGSGQIGSAFDFNDFNLGNFEPIDMSLFDIPNDLVI